MEIQNLRVYERRGLVSVRGHGDDPVVANNRAQAVSYVAAGVARCSHERMSGFNDPAAKPARATTAQA